MNQSEQIAELREQLAREKNRAGRLQACLDERAPVTIRELSRCNKHELRVIAANVAIKRCDGSKRRAAKAEPRKHCTFCCGSGKSGIGMIKDCKNCDGTTWDLT